MFLGVRELELRKIRFEMDFRPGDIDLSDSKLNLCGPLQAQGTAELVGSIQEIRVCGRLRGQAEFECDRCLETARLPLEGEMDLFYRPAKLLDGNGEMEVNRDEIGVGFYEGPGLELAEVVREQVMLWLPMQRLCREDCRGICPVCGENRNLAGCVCPAGPRDARWAGLGAANLFEKD